MVQENLLAKYNELQLYLKKLSKVAVAFSGGVDSTFLLYAAKEALGPQAMAITVSMGAVPQAELEEAKAYCQKLGISHEIRVLDEMDIPEFSKNPKDRCYHCKKALFTEMLSVAKSFGIENLIEGANKDDEGDYRPGMKAVEELQVKSPLRELGFTKDEIRILSKKFGVPTYNKPSFACLASRVPYGEKITKEKLSMVENAEKFLRELGFVQYRVRLHEGKADGALMARIELLESDIPKLLKDEIRIKVNNRLKQLGFSYVTIDIQGFRSGSMNEVLDKK
ncbi:MAG: ATP-dependent sacrificial sulfur transferase LarE [Pseudobutyrivibrio sp.]|nr:ATP-dependent sacrificial sulfur transferase LarE [Pseudobutyrivibrio sp.]